jgi:hypothetical protein
VSLKPSPPLTLCFRKDRNTDAGLSTKLNSFGKNGKRPSCMTGALLLTVGKQRPRMKKTSWNSHEWALAIKCYKAHDDEKSH